MDKITSETIRMHEIDIMKLNTKIRLFENVLAKTKLEVEELKKWNREEKGRVMSDNKY